MQSTPLWLDLKKEYIDDNFEKLLGYLRDGQGIRNNDSFYNPINVYGVKY